MRASFLADNKALSLLGGDAGVGNPWFGKEALLKPREAVVASPGFTFISADYSQVGYKKFVWNLLNLVLFLFLQR